MRNSSVNTKGRDEGDSSAACGGLHVGAGDYTLKELQPTESPCGNRLLAGTTARGGPMLEQGRSVRKKRQRSTAMSAAPIPYPSSLCLSGWSGGRGGGNEGVKMSPEKEKGGGEVLL